jgi:S-adenosylmethionine-diacylgycerolhomoserine-N-methlytransferase
MKPENLERFYAFHAKIYDYTRWTFSFDRRKAVDYLDLKPTDRVIDFACGTAMNIRHILAKGPRSIEGIDYSENMLKVARKKFPQVKFIQGDITTYRFDYQADKAISSYALTMIPVWQAAIKGIADNLTPDGTLVLLDFHDWRGVFKPLFPIFRWWMGMNGLEFYQPIEAELNKHFHEVEMHIRRSGYNYIAVARRPKR